MDLNKGRLKIAYDWEADVLYVTKARRSILTTLNITKMSFCVSIRKQSSWWVSRSLIFLNTLLVKTWI